MKPSRSPVEVAVLDSLEATQVLLDSRQRTAFLPFVGRTVSVSQAAREAGELPSTTLYRVRRWLRLGLLEAAGELRRPRGRVTLYRSSAPAFFVPHRATSAEDLLTLAQELHRPTFSAFLQAYAQAGEALSPDWGVHFCRQGEGWAVRPAKAADDLCAPTDPDAPPSLLEAAELCLEPAQAKALQQALWALLEQYRGQQTLHGKVYRVLLGMA